MVLCKTVQLLHHYFFFPDRLGRLTHVSQRVSIRASLGNETVTDLDYANDVALLGGMLEVLLLALEVLKGEAHPLGLEVNWQKTKKIQSTINAATLPTSVSVLDNLVKIEEFFVYIPRFRNPCHS